MKASAILDSIRAQTADLKNELPANDRPRLDAYVDDIREVERRRSVGSTSHISVVFAIPVRALQCRNPTESAASTSPRQRLLKS
jgi:hypothetical protein